MMRRDEPLLLVDAGNLLFPQTGPSAISTQDTKAAETIMAILHDLGYQALAVGPLDLAAGPDLIRTSSSHGIPWISANLVDDEGKPLVAPWRVVEIGDRRVGIIGLTGMVENPTGYHFLAWDSTLDHQLAKLGSQSDLIILLSTLDKEENRAIVERFPEITLLISADANAGNVPPHLLSKTLVTQTHTQGKYMGILQFDWPENGSWPPAGTASSQDADKNYGRYSFRFRSLSASTQGAPDIKKRIAELLQGRH